MRCSLLRHSPLFVAILISLAAAGCGPMFLPMNPRLSDEDQKQIDAVWNNMLTPVDRVEHQTLLDVTISFWLYQYGVDRLHLVSEKYLANGKVIMEIECDRASPTSDQFTITVLNAHGQTLRRERYSREEIEQSAKILFDAPPSARGPAFATKNEVEITTSSTTQRSTRATTEPSETPDDQHHRLERERRLKAIEAATQPAPVK